MYYLKKEKKKPLTDKNNSKSSLVKKLDRVFSLYIRLRDTMPNGMCRCISCGNIKPFAQIDAGHYFSRTHMATRFSELNVNAECNFCNRFKADHLDAYRDNLIRKIGKDKFELLRIAAHQSQKWSDFELEAMIQHYKKEVKKLSEIKGIKVKV